MPSGDLPSLLLKSGAMMGLLLCHLYLRQGPHQPLVSLQQISVLTDRDLRGRIETPKTIASARSPASIIQEMTAFTVAALMPSPIVSVKRPHCWPKLHAVSLQMPRSGHLLKTCSMCAAQIVNSPPRNRWNCFRPPSLLPEGKAV